MSLPDGSALTPVGEALALLLSRLVPTDVEVVALAQASGRVLAEAVTSAMDLPGCDNSAMDGYAVRAADCAGASLERPAILPVRGEARAGHPPSALQAGAAMVIATGAPLPRHADAVVRVEDTRRRGGSVEFATPVDPGTSVRRAGSDVRPGTVMVPAGRRLRPVDIAACAAVGAATVAVRRRPRVAILGGGDELVPVDVTPASHQVIDSNSPLLAAAVGEAGGEAVVLGVMDDDPAAVRRHLEEASACDLVISTAGVSVGAHDHVRSVVGALGEVIVWRVAIRPGKPLLIGEIGGTCVLGLPGNPVSSAVTFELFARPAILALQGAAEVSRGRIAVRMTDAISTPTALETYVRVRLHQSGTDPLPEARLSGEQGSWMLRSLADADALAIVPAGIAAVSPGTVLAALSLG